ncbi:MAG: sugar MFS transporter [Pyrinomonadaceae bacterium]
MKAPAEPRTDRSLTFLLHFVFLLSGIATVLIGQVLPHLTSRFALDDLQAGYFFPAQFAGSLTGTLLTNWLGRSGRLIPASAAGGILMAVGILMMDLASYQAVLVGFLINGLGIGLTLPAINVLILERDPARSASNLAFLNFFWGVGAIISKPYVDLTATGSSLGLTTVLLAAPLLISSVALFFAPAKAEARVQKASERTSELSPIWTNPMAWAIAAFNFIHVGFESGMGGWLTTYTGRVETTQAIQFSSPTFLFFLFFVSGRGISPLFFRYLDENKVLMTSLLVIFGGLVITLLAADLFVLGLGASICGVGTSAIFPTNVSRFSKTFGPDAMRRATPLFICGTLGATVVTWLIGFLSNYSGSLRSGMAVLAVSIILLILLQIGLSAYGRRSEQRVK